MVPGRFQVVARSVLARPRTQVVAAEVVAALKKEAEAEALAILARSVLARPRTQVVAAEVVAAPS